MKKLAIALLVILSVFVWSSCTSQQLGAFSQAMMGVSDSASRNAGR